MAAILFDLGGTYLRCAVEFECASVSADSLTHRQKLKIPNFLTSASHDAVWEGLLGLVANYTASVSGVVGPQDPIILGFPGPIGPGSKILAAPTVAGKTATIPDFGGMIRERTGRPVHLLNDISAAAWRASTLTSANRFIIVTISSGIGSKVFDRTSSSGVLDDLPFAGELGHIVVDPSPTAPICDCGVQGHLGAISSGRGIERAGRQKAQQDAASFSASLAFTRFGATAGTLNNEEHLVPAAVAGDHWALGVIAGCTEPLGLCLATVVAAMGLEQIAVIGGFAQSLGRVYRQVLEASLRRHELFPGFPNFGDGFIQLHPPKDEVCLMGAATYAHHRLGLP